MLSNILRFVAHKDIFIAIKNSSLCHFSVPQTSMDKCTSECRVCGKSYIPTENEI